MPQNSGETFENRVFKLIQDELRRERLGLLPHACTIFQRKGYRSRDRGTDIVVDVSVEVVLPGAPVWSLLWVWECKDYRRPIGVEDVEEFWAKLQQVGGANVKGGFASTSALRSGALKYAKSKGLAVVRVLPDDQIHWVLHMEGLASLGQLSAEEEVVNAALTTMNYRGGEPQDLWPAWFEQHSELGRSAAGKPWPTRIGVLLGFTFYAFSASGMRARGHMASTFTSAIKAAIG